MTPDQPVPYTLTSKAHAALVSIAMKLDPQFGVPPEDWPCHPIPDPAGWDLDTQLPRPDAS